MEEKKTFRFSIRKKLVVGISGLALITYGTSAFFIFILAESLGELLHVNQDIITLLILGMGVFWSAFLGFLAAPIITKPLSKLEIAARKAADGDVKDDVNVSKSDDELRALGLAFNNMLGNLRHMVRDIDNNFKQTDALVSEISNASDAAAQKADSISRTIDEISKGAQSAAVAIQKTAKSMEDVTSIAEQVQSRANQSKQSADDMVNKLVESRNVVTSLVSGIKQLASDNQQSLQVVGRLDNQAKQISEIISLVGDISGQTNLLALNASIEAARAGDHGKGFAVVADEVRKLADESSQAVQGITDLIVNMQEEVKNVVLQITNQVEVAENESSRGTKTTEAIGQMEKSILEVTSVIHEISKLIDTQLSAIMATTRETQEVAAIAQETSSGATEVITATNQQTSLIQEVANTAQVLSFEAKKLKTTIEKFST